MSGLGEGSAVSDRDFNAGHSFDFLRFRRPRGASIDTRFTFSPFCALVWPAVGSDLRILFARTDIIGGCLSNLALVSAK
jgi:hypothetical protein